MIHIYLQLIDEEYYAFGYQRKEILASITGTNKQDTFRNLISLLPIHEPYELDYQTSKFTQKIITHFHALHKGQETKDKVKLAFHLYPPRKKIVLEGAAAVPLGYVTTYGELARIADISPRIVGQIMANNPLYPFVPCHRIVGSNFSLVGYGGQKTETALLAKLKRLNHESRAYFPKSMLVNEDQLSLFPVERVIQKAKSSGLTLPDQFQNKLIQFE